MQFRHKGKEFAVALRPAEDVGELAERGVCSSGVAARLSCSRRNIRRMASMLSLRCAFLLYAIFFEPD